MTSKEAAKLLRREAGAPYGSKQEASLQRSTFVNRYDYQFPDSLLRKDHVAAGLSLYNPSDAPKGFDSFRSRDVGEDAHGLQSSGR